MPSSLTIYGHDQCRWCQAAVVLCQSLRLPVDYRNIRKSDADLAELMRRAPSAKTVPQIFAGDRLIGGYADLEAAAARGELAQLLTD